MLYYVYTEGASLANMQPYTELFINFWKYIYNIIHNTFLVIFDLISRCILENKFWSILVSDHLSGLFLLWPSITN